MAHKKTCSGRLILSRLVLSAIAAVTASACTVALSAVSLETNQTPAERLEVTRFVAFGDSITAGVVTRGARIDRRLAPHAYPFWLLEILTAKFPNENITVINAGRWGELAGRAVPRFQRILHQDAPQVVLLIEGTNDLNTYGRSGMAAALGALRTMIEDAKRDGVSVLLGTLPPELSGGLRAHSVSLVPLFNRQLRLLASRQDLDLVDINALFTNRQRTLIGSDGLHPSGEGYKALATAFANAIESRFEY